MNHHHSRYHNSIEASAPSAIPLTTPPSNSRSAEPIAALAAVEQPCSSGDILADSYMPLSISSSSKTLKKSRYFRTKPQHQGPQQQQYPTPQDHRWEATEHNNLGRRQEQQQLTSIIPPPSFVTVDESSHRSIRRRGAAGYSELLKSAFEASMNFDIEFDDDDDDDDDDENYRIQRRRQEDDDYSSIRSDCTSQEEYSERKRRRSLSSIASGSSSNGFPATPHHHTPITNNTYHGNKRRRTSIFLGSMFQGMELQTNNTSTTTSAPSKSTAVPVNMAANKQTMT